MRNNPIFEPRTTEILFALNVAGIENPEKGIVEAGAKFAKGVLWPLYTVGDEHPARLVDGKVVTPPGFKEAFAKYMHAGWGSGETDQAHHMALQEMFQGANPAFGVGVLLSDGARKALDASATLEQKEAFADELVAALAEGRMTGTMNLTEPQAGSDVGAVKTKAVRMDDGSYRISGEKIYISMGDHDYDVNNIVHLVLARLEGAVAGTKGLSLFVVTKFNEYNGVPCGVKATRLEHKMGIHGSPTAEMLYDDAYAMLVGKEGDGMKNMFVMMNEARLGVGIQGLGIAERALQQATAYAAQRVQGGIKIEGYPAIINKLMRMRSQISAGRVLAYSVGKMIDDGDPDGFVSLLTPVVKATLTDLGVEATQDNISIHGGAGYVEDTGAAQLARDAKIFTIYEGTNDIQAKTFLKFALGQGGPEKIAKYLSRIKDETNELESSTDEAEEHLVASTLEAVAACHTALTYLLKTEDQDAREAAAGDFMRLFALTAMAGAHCRMVVKANDMVESDPSLKAFADDKREEAFSFSELVLPEKLTLEQRIEGTSAVSAIAARRRSERIARLASTALAAN